MFNKVSTRTSFTTIPPLWWPTTVKAKPKTSRQKQNTSRQNQKPHGKNKIPHGKTKNFTAKTKYLTAKPNTSQQKQNSFGFAVGICFCREVFGFCCEVFGFAVKFLFLPWGFRFCREVFCFCREVFHFWFCRDSCGPPSRPRWTTQFSERGSSGRMLVMWLTCCFYGGWEVEVTDPQTDSQESTNTKI